MRKNKKNIVAYIIFVLFAFLIFACDRDRVYEDWQEMKDNVWLEDSTYHFTFELEDSIALYNLNFGIRHTNLYPYRNIWLLTSISGGDSVSYQDTIQLVLADKNGVWYGERGASIYTFVIPLYRRLQFFSPGEYAFTIKHGMREEALTGVTSIGFRVEKTNFEKH